MRTAFVDSGGEPLGETIEQNHDYPDVSATSSSMIGLAERWMRDLCCSGNDGDLVFSVKDSTIKVTVPKLPARKRRHAATEPHVETAAEQYFRINAEADQDAVEAPEKTSEPDVFDQIRNAARVVPESAKSLLAIGGDCPICKTALISRPFDAECAPPIGAGHLTLELWAQKLVTPHIAWLNEQPAMADIRTICANLQRDAVAAVRAKSEASDQFFYGDADGGETVVDAVERLEATPTTRDIADIELERLQNLGQGGGGGANYGGGKADLIIAAEVMERDREALKMLAEGAEPGCTHAPIRTESTGWTIDPKMIVGPDRGSLAMLDGDPERSEEETMRAAEFFSVAADAGHVLIAVAEKPHDGPNAAPPPQHAAASGTGSPASPAASALDLETACGADLDKIAAEKFDVKRKARETDSSLRAFLRAKQKTASDLSGCTWVNPVATATDPAADREDLARVTPAALRSGDLSGAWRGIAGSAAVEVGGRFHLNDISDAVND